MTYAGKNLIGW